MNIKEYISSGILEAYVLGELTAQEMASVEKNLAQYPELQQELTQIEEAQEKLLMGAAIQPRSTVKAKLFEKIDRQKPAGKIASLTSTPRLGVWKFAAAASITIAVVATYFALEYRSRWRSSESDLSELIAQNQKIAQDYNQVNQDLDKLENDLKVVENPEFKRVPMKGTDNAPSALAAVYWNESTSEVYLSIQNMKTLARQNQYQLWAIIDGKPVDAGVFDGNVAGLLKMKNIAKGASTFAVTIESRGGKPTPSLETMQVVGNVTKG